MVINYRVMVVQKHLYTHRCILFALNSHLAAYNSTGELTLYYDACVEMTARFLASNRRPLHAHDGLQRSLRASLRALLAARRLVCMRHQARQYLQRPGPQRQHAARREEGEGCHNTPEHPHAALAFHVFNARVGGTGSGGQASDTLAVCKPAVFAFIFRFMLFFKPTCASRVLHTNVPIAETPDLAKIGDKNSCSCVCA
jgi:hypothetical protein